MNRVYVELQTWIQGREESYWCHLSHLRLRWMPRYCWTAAKSSTIRIIRPARSTPPCKTWCSFGSCKRLQTSGLNWFLWSSRLSDCPTCVQLNAPVASALVSMISFGVFPVNLVMGAPKFHPINSPSPIPVLELRVDTSVGRWSHVWSWPAGDPNQLRHLPICWSPPKTGKSTGSCKGSVGYPATSTLQPIGGLDKMNPHCWKQTTENVLQLHPHEKIHGCPEVSTDLRSMSQTFKKRKHVSKFVTM